MSYEAAIYELAYDNVYIDAVPSSFEESFRQAWSNSFLVNVDDVKMIHYIDIQNHVMYVTMITQYEKGFAPTFDTSSERLTTFSTLFSNMLSKTSTLAIFGNMTSVKLNKYSRSSSPMLEPTYVPTILSSASPTYKWTSRPSRDDFQMVFLTLIFNGFNKTSFGMTPQEIFISSMSDAFNTVLTKISIITITELSASNISIDVQLPLNYEASNPIIIDKLAGLREYLLIHSIPYSYTGYNATEFRYGVGSLAKTYAPIISPSPAPSTMTPSMKYIQDPTYESTFFNLTLGAGGFTTSTFTEICQNIFRSAWSQTLNVPSENIHIDNIEERDVEYISFSMDWVMTSDRLMDFSRLQPKLQSFPENLAGIVEYNYSCPMYTSSSFYMRIMSSQSKLISTWKPTSTPSIVTTVAPVIILIDEIGKISKDNSWMNLLYLLIFIIPIVGGILYYLIKKADRPILVDLSQPYVHNSIFGSRRESTAETEALL